MKQYDPLEPDGGMWIWGAVAAYVGTIFAFVALFRAVGMWGVS